MSLSYASLLIQNSDVSKNLVFLLLPLHLNSDSTPVVVRAPLGLWHSALQQNERLAAMGLRLESPFSIRTDHILRTWKKIYRKIDFPLRTLGREHPADDSSTYDMGCTSSKLTFFWAVFNFFCWSNKKASLETVVGVVGCGCSTPARPERMDQKQYV